MAMNILQIYRNKDVAFLYLDKIDNLVFMVQEFGKIPF